ncbi:hypothetical protein Tco_0027027 [Tanacetum coccineum]
MPEIALRIIESKILDMVKALLLDKKSQAPAPVKAVEESCVTCGGAYSYQNCPATDDNIYRDNIQEYVSQDAAANYNQGNTSYRSPIANQIRPPGFPPFCQFGNVTPPPKRPFEETTIEAINVIFNRNPIFRMLMPNWIYGDGWQHHAPGTNLGQEKKVISAYCSNTQRGDQQRLKSGAARDTKPPFLDGMIVFTKQA